MNYKLLLLLGSLILVLASCKSESQAEAAEKPAGAREYYQLRVYHFANPDQERMLDQYFEDAFIPAFHRADLGPVGVFKAHDRSDSSLYVLLRFPSLKDCSQLNANLEKDSAFLEKAKDWIHVPHDQPPYARMESYILHAFKGTPTMQEPELESARSDRVYELRSYESATEKLHELKVEMFDQGESRLFLDLGFQPVFFGKVLSGPQMPNLMYMTTHADSSAQKRNWDAFRNHPEWDRMKNMERYQNTVSHIDIFLLYPTEYSDY